MAATIKERLTSVEVTLKQSVTILERLDIALLGDDTDNSDGGITASVRINTAYRHRLQTIHSKVFKYTLGLVPLTITGYITYIKTKWGIK